MDPKLRDMLTVDDIPPPEHLAYEQHGFYQVKRGTDHSEEDSYCFYCSGEHLHASVLEDECRYRYDLPPLTDEEFLAWWKAYETPYAERYMDEEDLHSA